MHTRLPFVLLLTMTSSVVLAQNNDDAAMAPKEIDSVWMDTTFEDLDVDRDEFISYTEAQTFQMKSGLWKEYDVNQDEVWDRSEFGEYLWNLLDEDDSGYLSASEINDYSSLSDQMGELDTDDDQQLSRSEFGQYDFVTLTIN